MNISIKSSSLKWIWITGLVLVVAVSGLTWQRWFPIANSWVESTVASFRSGGASAHGDDHHEHADHDEHDHSEHAGHDESSSLELSSQALLNIGLNDETIRPVKLETFRKSITVPALVIERPGRTRVQVAASLTGVITKVHAVQGEAVEPGTLLFQVRLTHEDLVRSQTEFLRTLGELDVEEREMVRLREVTKSGAVAGKLLLEREYSRDKLSALMRAQREALRLHGLSEKQVDQIVQDRRLLRELQIFAPSVDGDDDEELKLTESSVQTAAFEQVTKPGQRTTPLILQDLMVHQGQSVNAGETLCVLTDYEHLFIEGMAFEQDFNQLRHASENEWTVDAIFEQPGEEVQTIEGLQIAYFANQIDLDSRTLHFYVRFPNLVTKDRRADGNRYVEWKYLPGQRLQVRVPVQEWADQIVVPVDAVAREGAEYFVFQQNGDHFDRVSVHVKYRDQYSAVINNDGSLYPGDVIAMHGAHQMQMAIKNKSGGGVDPHAGHSH